METTQPATTYLTPMVFYPLLSIVIVLLVVFYYMTTSHLYRLGSKIPGPKGLPLVGVAHVTLNLDPKNVLSKMLEYDIYGPVAGGFLGTKFAVFLFDPHDVEIILSSHVHIDKSLDYKYFQPWLGDGLLISSGEKWRSHRRIIAPTFHMNILKMFVPFFYENSKELVTELRREIGKEFDCHDYLGAATVNTLLQTMMGFKESQLKTEEKYKRSFTYASAVMKMCDIIHQRQYKILLRPDFLFRLTGMSKEHDEQVSSIHALTDRVIRVRKQEISEDGEKNHVPEEKPETRKSDTNGTKRSNYTRMHYVRDDLDDIEDNDVGEKKRLPFLDLLLNVAKNTSLLTDEEVKEQVNTIMFEGHDTVAAASSFVLCVLGIHQNIQERVYEEINEIFDGSDRQCTFQDTLEMKYLERVIMETLRLYPPVPVIARDLTEDVKIVTGDYVLPKGTTVLIAPWKIHRQPEYYPNPYVFDPDNFLPERMHERHYYSFIPFSAGPRSCVGRKYAMLKLKVLLSTILRSYKILSDIPEDKYDIRVDIILKRQDGFRIKIEPRDKTTEPLPN